MLANCVGEVFGPFTDQSPVPTPGIFPERIALPVTQMVCAEPFVAMVGSGLLVITTSSVEAAQGALAIVHLSVDEAPTVNPVTADVGDEGVVATAVPEIVDQLPTPIVAVLPAKVAVVELQRV